MQTINANLKSVRSKFEHNHAFFSLFTSNTLSLQDVVIVILRVIPLFLLRCVYTNEIVVHYNCSAAIKIVLYSSLNLSSANYLITLKFLKCLIAIVHLVAIVVITD